MDAYVSEQEQVEQIRRWWKNNGNALLLGLALGIGGLACLSLLGCDPVRALGKRFAELRAAHRNGRRAED